MGAGMGAITSIFPSDENVRRFLKAQGRENNYIPSQQITEQNMTRLIEAGNVKA